MVRRLFSLRGAGVRLAGRFAAIAVEDGAEGGPVGAGTAFLEEGFGLHGGEFFGGREGRRFFHSRCVLCGVCWFGWAWSGWTVRIAVGMVMAGDGDGVWY